MPSGPARALLPLFHFTQYALDWAVGETRAEDRNVKMTGTPWKYTHFKMGCHAE